MSKFTLALVATSLLALALPACAADTDDASEEESKVTSAESIPSDVTQKADAKDALFGRRMDPNRPAIDPTIASERISPSDQTALRQRATDKRATDGALK